MILLLSVATLTTAQAADLTLTYEEALARAAQQNPTVRAALADVDAAEGYLLSTRGVFDPTLSATLGYSSRTDQDVFAGVGTYEAEFYGPAWSLGVSNYLPTGTTLTVDWTTSRSSSRFTLGGVSQNEITPFDTELTAAISQSLLQGYRSRTNLAGVRAATQSLTSAELTAQIERQSVLGQTAEAYWGLYYQQELVEIAQETLQVTEEERRIVLARIERGDIAPMERSRVEAAVLSAQSQLLDAQNAAVTAGEALRLLIGEDPAGTVQLPTAPDAPAGLLPTDEVAVAEALEHNPTLQQLKLAEQAAADNLADAAHYRLPELTGTAQYSLLGWENNLDAAIGEMLSAELPGWYVGVDLSVPIRNRVDRGTYDQRQGELASARIEREAYERSLLQQVRAQVRTLQSAQLKISLAEANLQAARDTLAADQALRDAGRAIERDVLESIRDVGNAQVALEQARADYLLALVALQQLQGQL